MAEELKKTEPVNATPAAKAPVKETELVKKETKPEVSTPATATPQLPKDVFGVKVNTQAIFDSIMSERASKRQGTHSVKTRGEVRGGGKKPFAQKGTGNARQGSIRSPQWVGGGIVWGPTTERNYTLKVNKKVKKLAFASALTLKAKEKAVTVNDLASVSKPSTKDLLKSLEALKIKKDFKKILIVTENANVWKSASNLPKIFATRLSSLSIESIVNADFMIFSKKTMTKLGGTK